MKTFGIFLTESSKKNLHIEHLEDEVFNRGVAGASSSISFLNGFNSLLEGSGGPTVKASVKWDGSPSIVCGPHPKTGRFFIGTKSVFNTTIPKINYSEADICENHGDKPDLAERLCVAFRELAKLSLTEVVQGDLLFVEQDLKPQTHNGQTHITFKPNTITYSIPTNTTLGEAVSNAKIGVSFHTSYSGLDIDSLIPSYGVQLESSIPSIIIFNHTLSPKSTLQVEGQNTSNLIESFNSLDQDFLKTISNTTVMQRAIKRYINSKVALGESVSATDSYITEFYQFIENNHKNLLGYFLEHRSALHKTFVFVEQLISTKNKLLHCVSHKDNITMFIESESGFKQTDIEGVVLSDNSGNVVKAVNRLEFSHHNFKGRQ